MANAQVNLSFQFSGKCQRWFLSLTGYKFSLRTRYNRALEDSQDDTAHMWWSLRTMWPRPAWKTTSNIGTTTTTTNAVEGWHHKWNTMCRRPHPNIYLFIQTDQKEQAAKIIQLDAWDIVRPKKRKYCQIDQRIHRLRQNAIGVMEYADAASHLLHLQ